MLDNIKALFKEGLEYTYTAGLLQQMANVINIVNGQYMKEPCGKNKAIDAICALLQTHKDVAPPEAPKCEASAPQETTNAAQ